MYLLWTFLFSRFRNTNSVPFLIDRFQVFGSVSASVTIAAIELEAICLRWYWSEFHKWVRFNQWIGHIALIVCVVYCVALNDPINESMTSVLLIAKGWRLNHVWSLDSLKGLYHKQKNWSWAFRPGFFLRNWTVFWGFYPIYNRSDVDMPCFFSKALFKD